MAAIYPHKKGGREVFQVRFNLYLPDGSRKTVFRYRHTKVEAIEMSALVDRLESGSRSSTLTWEEIAQAQRIGLLRPAQAAQVGGLLPQRRKLSTLIERYIEVHEDIWRFRSAQKPREQFKKVLEVLGDVYTAEINQDMLVRLFHGLTRYPKWRNHLHLGALTLEQCGSHPRYQPISTTTFTAIWEALGGLLTYGHENGGYGIDRNFCRDKIFSVKKKVMKKSQKGKEISRAPYESAEIQLLIDQLGTVAKVRNPHMLWIPLIALFSGMRQGEICQLYCDDIVDIKGIHCFRIRNCPHRKQSVKTEQSERTIPVHPVLLKLGFLEFIESRRRLRYERLWQNVKSRPVEYYEKQDTYAHYFEKWYNGTFSKYVILDPVARKRKPFHSLRHTFINWFFQNVPSQDRDNAAVKGLVGHLESEEQKMVTAMLKGISWDVYSQDLNPARLMETSALLDYGVDLSPLGLPVKW